MKRLFLLISLLLGFAAPSWAETKTDTIYFEYEVIDNTSVVFDYYFSEKVASGIEIEWEEYGRWNSTPTGNSERKKPNSGSGSITHNKYYGTKGFFRIYYTYDNPTTYTVGLSEEAIYYTSLDGYVLITNISTDIFLYAKETNLKSSSLDVSGCSNLKELWCGNQGLTSVNAKGTLTSIDAKGCTSLTKLSCFNNQLTSLDVSSNTALTSLSCSYNQLMSLDVSNNTALTSLFCIDNQLTSLDVSNNTALTSLNCSNNQLTSLDVSNNTALTSLDCSNNQLTSLDVTGFTSLISLKCMNNQLPSLNASNCTSLKYFDCTENPLASLNLSNCRSLEPNYIEQPYLTTTKYWDWEPLRTLNVSNWPQLKKFSCLHTQLIELDISGCTNLTELEWDNKRLIRLNASGCTSLSKLYCQHNQLTNLNISGCTYLNVLVCDNNQLTSLDASDCPRLSSLSCQNNLLRSLLTNGGTYLKASENHIPLSILYKNKQHRDWRDYDWVQFIAAHQSDTITIRINQSLNLSSERMLGDSVSIFEILDISGQDIPSSSYSEDNFIFRFPNPGQYILTLQNPNLKNKSNQSGDTINGTPITFSLIVSVEEELPTGYVTAQVSPNNSEWGKATITGYGTYNEGTEVTITATPQEGGRFINWTKENGEVFCTEAEYTFTVTENLELTANFEEMFTVNLSVNNPALGSVSLTGIGRYTAGTEVTITATPQEDSRFINWTKENGELFSTEAVSTFTVTENLELTANFEELFTVNLSVNNPDFGSVSLTGIGKYAAGTEVTITATPQEGGRFINWTKDNGSVFSTEAEYTFTVTENLELTANFEEMFTVNLSANNPDFGSVSLTGIGRYTAGTEVTITATPQGGSRFINWTKENGNVFSTEAEYTFTVTENLELTANFEEIPEKETFLIELSSNNPDWGLVVLVSSSYNWGYIHIYETYEKGTDITIRAEPRSGYRFVNWTKADGSVFSTKVEYTFTVTENLELIANFEEIPIFTISFHINNPEWGSINYFGGYFEGLEGDEITIACWPSDGYRFVNWTKADGSVFCTEAEYTFTVTENLELTANFEEKETFTVNLYTNNSNWGGCYTRDNGPYWENKELTIYASPEWGYHFVNWTKADGSVFSTEAEYTFEVTENLDLTANFAPNGGVGYEKPPKDNLAVYVQDRTIRLSEARGAVQVFNTAGQCIYNGSSTLIPVPHSGIYIVKVGARNYKVVVR